MNIKIISPNEVNTVTDADIVLVDIRNYGGFYVNKNSYGMKNFVLPPDYLGLFLTQPNLVPSFSLSLPALSTTPALVEASPLVVALKSNGESASNRPPV